MSTCTTVCTTIVQISEMRVGILIIQMRPEALCGEKYTAFVEVTYVLLRSNTAFS
jgi:hypothetical protein